MIERQVKIVIWDLDDTFWNGTLSEGEVTRIEANIKTVKTLIDRGIMCSIVSKNDYSQVKNILSNWGIWELFIFPHVSWQPKGEQVKDVLKKAALRAANTLFIDDNLSNLKEVEFYNPGIMVELPNVLNDDFLELKELQGKNDIKHSRLQQYKILEERDKESTQFSDNKEFLRESDIKIIVSDDCEKNIDRIVELVQRSNQLNYTKIRSTKEELLEIIKDNEYESAYISVKDKFGIYGIVGFYALKNKKLLHFVFSCRIIGFGVENYLYRKLGYPEVDVIGEIATELSKEYAEGIDWITEDSKLVVDNVSNRSSESILMISGCDLEQACAYLDTKYEIKKEFATVINGVAIKTSDTTQLLNSIDLNENEKRKLYDNLSFINKDISFNSCIFSNNYDTVVLSVVDDYIRGIWKNKINGYLIGFGGYFEIEKSLSCLPVQEKEFLLENFEFVGKEKECIFEDNLRRIIGLIGNNVNIILINGIDLDVSDWIGEERVQRNLEMNNIVDRIVREYNNVHLLDMRHIITSKEMLTGKDNRHFNRKAYFEMAKELSALINAISSCDVTNLHSRLWTDSVGKIITRVQNKIKKDE